VLNELQLEEERLAALYACGLLDTAPSSSLDRLCRMAAHTLQVPVAFISLVDRHRIWFKSKVGLMLEEAPREQSFCSHTIKQKTILEVMDIRQDSRFCHLPVEAMPPDVRFYAGVPLIDRHGFALGSLCIMDTKPRQLSEADHVHLYDLANLVTEHIEQSVPSQEQDLISGFSGRPQFMADLQNLSHDASEKLRMLVLIDVLDSYRAQEIARAFGIEPFERFVQTLSQRLSSQLNGLATLYRITLTRFAFIMAINEGAYAEKMLNGLISSLRRTVKVEEVPIDPPVSAGVVVFDTRSDNTDDVIRKVLSAVDEALLTRAPWLYYEAGYDERFRRSFNLAADVQEAMQHNQLYLVFQPRLTLAEKTLAGAEVLLRWQHPIRGLIPPNEFIPVIEKTPLINQVTHWVIDKALAQLATWGSAFMGTLSINLSPRDFDDRRLVECFVKSCAEHHIDPNRIELEITEGEWLRNSPHILMQLTDLRLLGAHVAIDDFGSGYSNFAYLHEIPADVVKLDRSLIYGIETDARKQVLAEHIVSLVSQLGYRTVAEGIETEESFRQLEAYGCTEAQGYWLTKPLASSDFSLWCDAWKATSAGAA
jgi:EAL domain-containing protein (putative c-di-GMP-specific phosphodiesterase class I)/GGDEF domain-containing protein